MTSTSGVGDPCGAPPVPQASSAASFETDLPGELLSQGWRKFWSRRESRPYFFNRLTGETSWEMPGGAGGGYNSADPLGISSPPPPPVLGHPSKRRLSASSSSSALTEEPPLKKLVLNGPWDLEIPTNVILYEKTPSFLPHPHPEAEALRYSLVMKLRQSLEEICRSREGIDAPKDCFNRWLLERK
ncbi:PDX1 Cterminal inhibiting factor 1, partial [Caligus rogercresseyi]